MASEPSGFPTRVRCRRTSRWSARRSPSAAFQNRGATGAAAPRWRVAAESSCGGIAGEKARKTVSSGEPRRSAADGQANRSLKRHLFCGASFSRGRSRESRNHDTLSRIGGPLGRESDGSGTPCPPPCWPALARAGRIEALHGRTWKRSGRQFAAPGVRTKFSLREPNDARAFEGIKQRRGCSTAKRISTREEIKGPPHIEIDVTKHSGGTTSRRAGFAQPETPDGS